MSSFSQDGHISQAIIQRLSSMVWPTDFGCQSTSEYSFFDE